MDNKVLKFGYVFFSLILCLSLGIIGVKAQESQPQAGYTVFIPGVYNGSTAGHTISGRVLNPQNVPIPGVTLRTDQGQAAVTDQNGDYSLKRLDEGVYTLVPSLGDTTFSPATSAVVVPPDVVKLNFTAQVACSEALLNGSFEANSAWDIPLTAYPAGYSTAEAHTGSRSIRTGIVKTLDNVYSYSSTHQKVIVPSGTTSAYLTFWIKPFSDNLGILSLPSQPNAGAPLAEVQMSEDVQYVLVLDSNQNIIKTLLWQLSDSQAWTEYQFNLAAYAGRTIWLHFGTYNDGSNGISSMFVDDVSLEVCPGSGSPTPTPTPGPCSNLLDNPGFETVRDWEIPNTVYPAGYSTAQSHSGSWSMRTGILKLSDNIFSYSDFPPGCLHSLWSNSCHSSFLALYAQW